MKVLVDTNVIIDVLLIQDPFYKDSSIIYKLSESKHISGILASVSMANAFYILRRRGKSCDEAYQELDKLNIIFAIGPVSDTTISTALSLRWKDFEDAVQYTTAKESNVDFIITRNKSDFEANDISCMTPTEFIAYLKEKEEAESN